jgi:hypothetical protein
VGHCLSLVAAILLPGSGGEVFTEVRMAQGIPTVYDLVRFRSRLEAKWARFFDFCGWKWSYEPYDFAGWIPDFAIGDQLQTLVEVKPIMRLEQMPPADMKKLERAAKEGHTVLVLGADPIVWLGGSVQDGCPCIGSRLWAFSGRDIDTGRDEVVVSFEDIHFGFPLCANGKPGLSSIEMSWRNAVWSHDDTEPGKVCGDNRRIDARTLLITNWRKACNESQWMPGGNHGN